MKLTHLDLYSENLLVAQLSFRDKAGVNPYMARAIAGLDADEIIPNFYGFGAVSGKGFWDLRLPKRTLVMRIVLNPNSAISKTFSDLRDDIYRAISRTRNGKLQIRFMDGASIQAVAEGTITKVEVPHFSKVAELQITLICDDAFLFGYDQIELEADELGSPSSFYIYDSISTAPHGFDIELLVASPTKTLTIQSGDSDEWRFKVVNSVDFQVGDHLGISSSYKTKAVLHKRGDVVTSLFDLVDSASVWPVVFPGANHFKIVEADKFTINKAWYKTCFWGV